MRDVAPQALMSQVENKLSSYLRNPDWLNNRISVGLVSVVFKQSSIRFGSAMQRRGAPMLRRPVQPELRATQK